MTLHKLKTLVTYLVMENPIKQVECVENKKHVCLLFDFLNIRRVSLSVSYLVSSLTNCSHVLLCIICNHMFWSEELTFSLFKLYSIISLQKLELTYKLPMEPPQVTNTRFCTQNQVIGHMVTKSAHALFTCTLLWVQCKSFECESVLYWCVGGNKSKCVWKSTYVRWGE